MFIEPGLPNIKGQLKHDNELAGYASGAFYGIGSARNDIFGCPNAVGGMITNFDASRCSPIYGNSDTFQPAAYTVYYIMKVK